MQNRTSDALCAAYGLAAPIALLPLRGGVNNTNYRLESGDRRFFLKRYATTGDAESLNYEHQLLTWLATQSLPFAVPAPHPSVSGATLVQVDSALWGLFAWLPGAPPQPTVGQAEAFGYALGTLHHALALFPRTSRPGMAPYGRLKRVHPAVPDPEQLDQYLPELAGAPDAVEVLAWWNRKMRVVQAFVDGPYRQLPWQVIHGDVAFANSLFVGDGLTALLDFEFAGPDARAMDLAAAIHALLRHAPVDVMLPLIQALLRGYQRVTMFTEAERAALPELIRLRGAVGTIWWVGRHLAAHQPQAAIERMRRAWQYAITFEAHVRSLHTWIR